MHKVALMARVDEVMSTSLQRLARLPHAQVVALEHGRRRPHRAVRQLRRCELRAVGRMHECFQVQDDAAVDVRRLGQLLQLGRDGLASQLPGHELVFGELLDLARV